MLVLIVLLFAVSWFPFFTVQLYLISDDEAHRHAHIRTTVAILQLVGYRSFFRSAAIVTRSTNDKTFRTCFIPHTSVLDDPQTKPLSSGVAREVLAER